MAAVSTHLASCVHGDSVQTTAGYLDAVVIGGRPGYRQQVGIEGCGAAYYWLQFQRETLLVRLVSIPLVTPIYKYWKDVLAVPGVLSPAVADSQFADTVRSATLSR